MKLAIIKEHRDFFQKQGFIEFENFLTSTELEGWNQGINEALASRLETSPDRLKHYSSEKVFLQGRDLWRANEALKKLMFQARYAKVASELVEKTPIRMGYDQLFPSVLKGTSSSIYKRFLEQNGTLEEVSCLRGIVCGLVVALGPSGEEQEALKSEEGAISIFPHSPGSAIFFDPKRKVDWQQLYQHSSQRFFLIVYTQAFAFYELQPNDPHTHALKHLGYGFHDKLSDRLNPVLYR